MSEVLVVGLGGFIGANARYGLTKLLPQTIIAVLAANVIAGFAIGFVLGLDGSRFGMSARGKLFVNTGLLGGLSTFSTFGAETVQFLREGRYGMMSLNVLLNVTLAVSATIAGLALAKLLTKGTVSP